MTEARQPSLRRRRLGARLKGLREGAGLKQEQVGAILGYRNARISRIESGEGKVELALLWALLDVYGVDRDSPQGLALADMVDTGGERNWWHTYRSHLGSTHEDLLGLEADTARLSKWEPSLFPAVLQTEPYIRGILAAGRDLHHGDTERLDAHVQLRLGRSRVLDRDDFALTAVVGESALRTSADAALMRGQLDHVVEASQRPNVSVRIVPFDSGFNLGPDGPFSLFELRDGSRLVMVESLLNVVYLEKPDELRGYATAFDQLCERALNERESRELMHARARSL
ncbi:helix-turn-helix domain-containing protein [Embleya scabrispora]|nr:helix-turn-helix transcriptional regulator [Embleya scabrispora]